MEQSKTAPTDAQQWIDPTIPVSPENQMTVADTLGLPQNLRVGRGEGDAEYFDRGWKAIASKEVTDKNGRVVTAVTIEKTIRKDDGSDEIIQKVRSRETLLGWQTEERSPQNMQRVGHAAAIELVALNPITTQSEYLENESRLNQRQQLVFAPFEKAAPTEVNETDYDKLFTNDYDATNNSVESAATRTPNKLGSREPSAEYEEVSAGVLNNVADITIKKIIAHHSPAAKSSLDLVKTVQNNAALRYDLATYFLGKIERLVDEMPDRIKANKQKKTDFAGYGDQAMTSREYATLLAISMLDGSFKPDAGATDDRIVTNEQGKVIRGQHRDAAYTLLS